MPTRAAEISPILHGFEFNRNYMHELVREIPDERMCQAAGAMINHPAWQLGHLCVILGYAGTMLGLDTMLDERWRGLFDRGSTVTDDRAAYPSKSELLEQYDAQHTALAEGLTEASKELLDAPTPEEFNMRSFAPTIRDAVGFLMTWHEGAHAGQLAAWRKAQGFGNVL